ncbi:MAG: GGDEF domain-containing protein [Gammaproteobacteria bacterium]|nr:GGDEF domain-containing protein [Gammaproteobacteria bacterium]
MSENSTQGSAIFSPAKTIAGILVITFAAELLVMALLSRFGFLTATPTMYAVNAAILCAVIAPPIFLFIMYPIQRMTDHLKESTTAGYPSNLDSLTQVLNHRAITVDLLESIAHSERYGNPLSVAVVDIDGLQGINDKFGNAVGDQVLQMVAGNLSEALRMPDRIGRYGDEEFLVVLPETETDDAKIIADRVRAKVSESSIECEGGPCKATISVGITYYSKGDDLEALLSRANAAIAEAKNKGSNRVVTKQK